MSMSPHKQRLVTGFALAALMLLAVFTGGLLLQGIVLAAVSICLWEFYSLFWQQRNVALKCTGVAFGALLVATFASGHPQVALALLVPAFLVSALSFLFRFSSANPTPSVFTDHGLLPLGLLGIALPLTCTLSLTPAEQIFVVLIPVATDSGGFYAGMFFGKHKIWPKVSPKKTWEGAIGGMLACVVLCLTAGFIQSNYALGLPSLPLWLWPIAALLLNVTAQMGDFFESALKRSVGVKDSGNLLPGHGGLLDRLDSLLFVIPVYYCISLLARYSITVAPVLAP